MLDCDAVSETLVPAKDDMPRVPWSSAHQKTGLPVPGSVASSHEIEQ